MNFARGGMVGNTIENTNDLVIENFSDAGMSVLTSGGNDDASQLILGSSSELVFRYNSDEVARFNFDREISMGTLYLDANILDEEEKVEVKDEKQVLLFYTHDEIIKRRLDRICDE